MGDKYKIAVSYISNFQKLLVVSRKILPTNQVVSEIINKFNIAKTDEISFTEYTGQHVWRYREYIKRNNREEIMALDFRSDLQKRITTEDADSKLAREFLELLLGKVATLAPDEWDIVHKLVSAILADYGRYLQACILAANNQAPPS